MSDPAPADAGQAAPADAAPAQAAPQTAAQAISEPVAPPVTPTHEGAWYSSINEAHHGFIENKGWSSMDAVIDSYQNAEKMIGASPDKLLKIPNAEDTDGYAEVYNRLGRPDSPDGYNIEGLEEGDYGTWYKNTVHEVGLNDRQAKILQERHDAYVQEQQTKADESFVINAQNDLKELEHEWGQAYDQKMQQVKEGANKLGWSEEEVSQLERTVGTKRLMQTMAEIGASLGESPYHGTQNTATENVMTREGAVAAYKELMADNDFRAKLMSNDQQIRQQALAKQSKLAKLAYD